jgi:hypothetical protein
LLIFEAMSSAVEPETKQSSSAQESPSDAVSKSKGGKRRSNHRKRKQDAVKDSKDHVGSTEKGSKRKRKVGPFQGMILAISTLDVKGRAHTDAQSSYKAISDLCRTLGASVTGQLHSRVTCLICNRSAVQHATQRVRKALKKKVPLVDVAWVRQCHEEEKRIDHSHYCLDDLAIQVMESRTVDTADDAGVDVGEIPESAWSEPTSLGCCCVCHENGDDKCPWCSQCDVNMAKARTQS